MASKSCVRFLILLLSLHWGLGASIARSRRAPSYCSDRPCQNQGICIQGQVRSPGTYTCRCSVLYTGRHCETLWISFEEFSDLPSQNADIRETVDSLQTKSDNIPYLLKRQEDRMSSAWERKLANMTSHYETALSSLQSEVNDLRTTSQTFRSSAAGQLVALENKTQYLGSGCNLKTISYKYQVQRNSDDYDSEGDREVARISMTKKLPQTVLSVSFSGGVLASFSSSAGGRLYFKFDGKECGSPFPIDLQLHQSGSGSSAETLFLKGVCQNIGPGLRTISVHMEPRWGAPGGYTVWESTWTFEVQEMCPQF